MDLFFPCTCSLRWVRAGGVEEGESWMAGGGGCAAPVMDFAVEANVA